MALFHFSSTACVSSRTDGTAFDMNASYCTLHVPIMLSKTTRVHVQSPCYVHVPWHGGIILHQFIVSLHAVYQMLLAIGN
jgi:hypothetical protein